MSPFSRFTANIALAFTLASAPPAWSASASIPANLGLLGLAMIEGILALFTNAGEALQQSSRFVMEQVIACGGVRLRDGRCPLRLTAFDDKQEVADALLQ